MGKIKAPRTNTENCLAAVQLLTRQPRTARELSNLLGIKIDTVVRYLRLMEAEGLARRDGLAARQAVRGRLSERWAWVDVTPDDPARALLPNEGEQSCQSASL